MSLIAPAQVNSKNFVEQPNLEPGGYPARVVQVVAMGRMSLGQFDGKPKPPGLAVRITYELVDAFMVDEDGNELEDKPRWINEEFILLPMERDLAKSTKRYQAIDPKNTAGGDWTKLLGFPCVVTVVNNPSANGKTYDNVGTVAAARPRDIAGMADLKNPASLFLVDTPDMEVFNKLPKFLREKIMGNLDFEGSALQKALKASGGASAPAKAPKEEAPKEEPAPASSEEADDDVPW